MSMPALATLLLLLALPAYAASRLYPAVDWPVLSGVPLLLSIVAFLAYRSDKRRAQAGDARVPESTLHLLALAGGWPGAFLAQRTFRHKTSKASFQLVFWVTVLAYQYLAADALTGWRLSQKAWRFLT